MLWTVNLVIARKAPGILTPHVLALGRWGIAGALLAVVCRRELWLHRTLILKNAWRFCVLGACGMWICGAWVYVAAQSTSAMNISLIYASSPVLIALGSVVVLGERFSLLQKLGVMLALLGVVHVVVQGHWTALMDVQLVKGDLWVAAAATAWAAYALLQKRWAIPLSSTAMLCATCMGGVTILVPFAVWESMQSDAPAMTSNAIALILLAAVVPGVAAYWIYGWTQKVLGVGRVAVTLYLGPLYAAVISWLFLGEPLGTHHAVGGLCILSGVAMVVTFKAADLTAAS